MSISFTSAEAEWEDRKDCDVNVSNGTWKELTVLGHEADPSIEVWNGWHDSDQRWTPEQLRKLAELAQAKDDLADCVDWLTDLANQGTVMVS